MDRLNTVIRAINDIKSQAILQIKTKFIPGIKSRFRQDLERLFKSKKKLECVSAIEITDTCLKLINLDLSSGTKITFYQTFSLPNEKKEEFIQNTLKSLKNNLSEDMIIGLDDADVELHRVPIAVMPESEIPRALKWQIKDLIAFDLNKAIIEYRIIGEKTEADDSKKMEVMVFVANKVLIERYTNLVKQAGFNCLKVTIYPLDILHLVKADSELSTKKVVSILDIGQIYSNIYIYKDNILTFSRRVAVGSNHIAASLPNAIVSDLETRKKELIIPVDWDTAQNVECTQIMAMIRPTLEHLAQEIRRSVAYYASEFSEQDIAEIYMIGEGAGIKNLDRYLNQELKIPCKNLGLNENIQAKDREGLVKNKLLYFPVIGAALGVDDKINFLPFELRSSGMEELERVSLRMILFIIFAIFLLLSAILSFRISDYKKRIINAEYQLKVLSQAKELYSSIIEKINLINFAKQGNIPTEWILKDISNLITSQILLKDFRLDQQNDTLYLKGIAMQSPPEEDALTDFMNRLSQSPLFKKVSLNKVTKLEAGGRPASDFEITITLIE